MIRTPLLIAVIIGAAFFSSASDAATFLYEGFPAGGTTPAAGEYQSAPVSTNGVDNDSIQGQGPASGIGFNAGANWAGSPVASVIYPRVLNTGLSYTDTMGNTLITTDGAVDWHRGTSTNTDSKRETRATNLSPSLPNTAYFSGLFQFTSGKFGQFELTQDQTGGGDSRDLFFGFNSSGNVVAGTQGQSNPANNATVTSASSFTAGQTYLLFGEIVNNGSDDVLSLWINPSDLSDPTADIPVFDSLDIGAGWVGGNPNFTIRELSFYAGTSQNSQFIFDEIRVGDSAADVLPIPAAVPEPASLAVWALLGLIGVGVALRRRRTLAGRYRKPTKLVFLFMTNGIRQ